MWIPGTDKPTARSPEKAYIIYSEKCFQKHMKHLSKHIEKTNKTTPEKSSQTHRTTQAKHSGQPKQNTLGRPNKTHRATQQKKARAQTDETDPLNLPLSIY